MKDWIRVTCLAVGAALTFASVAAPEGAAPEGTARAGTVVEIKPNRIFLMDITRAGDRLVTVGERGFAMLSDDAPQDPGVPSGTPVTRTLTGVAFNDDKLGVAVGHGGSLVRTDDGGATWTAVPLDESFGESLLGVVALGDGRFAAYGAFGMYFDTVDGGKSWTKRMILSEEFEAHISQVVRVDGSLWLVGETGTLARSDECCATFTAVPSPYAGSFFGMVVGAGRGPAPLRHAWAHLPVCRCRREPGSRSRRVPPRRSTAAGCSPTGRSTWSATAASWPAATTTGRRSISSGTPRAGGSRRSRRCRAASWSAARPVSGSSTPPG